MRKEVKKQNKKEVPRAFRQDLYLPKKTLEIKERTVVNQQPKEETQGRPRWARWLLFFFWISVAAAVVYSILWSPFFRLQQVAVLGGSQVDQHNIETEVRNYCAGSLLRVIPKNNILFRKKSLETHLLWRFPRLASVHVERQLPGNITVKIEELPYQLQVCAEWCQLVDTSGQWRESKPFEWFPWEQGTVYQLHVGQGTHTEALDKRMLGFTRNTIEHFEEYTGLMIETTIEWPTVFAKEVHVKTKKGFWVYLNAERPLKEATDQLMLVLQKEVPENEQDQLEYVDIRTENRVYYVRRDRKPEKTPEELEAEKKAEEEKKKQEEENKTQEASQATKSE